MAKKTEKALTARVYEEPILAIIRAAGGEATAQYVLDQLGDHFQGRHTAADLSPRGQSGVPSWKNAVHLARFNLVAKRRLCSPQRGVWKLLDERGDSPPPAPVPSRRPVPVTTKAEITRRLRISGKTLDEWINGSTVREPLEVTRSTKGKAIRVMIPVSDLQCWLGQYRPDLLKRWDAATARPHLLPPMSIASSREPSASSHRPGPRPRHHVNDIKVVVIRGNFTQSEFEQLLELIRRMGNARSDAAFELVAADPANTSLEMAERLLRQAVPEMHWRSNDELERAL